MQKGALVKFKGLKLAAPEGNVLEHNLREGAARADGLIVEMTAIDARVGKVAAAAQKRDVRVSCQTRLGAAPLRVPARPGHPGAGPTLCRSRESSRHIV